MVTKKRTSGKAKDKKLKLKKETIKDIEPKGGSVKGGMGRRTGALCTVDCTVTVFCTLTK